MMTHTIPMRTPLTTSLPIQVHSVDAYKCLQGALCTTVGLKIRQRNDLSSPGAAGDTPLRNSKKKNIRMYDLSGFAQLTGKNMLLRERLAFALL